MPEETINFPPYCDSNPKQSFLLLMAEANRLRQRTTVLEHVIASREKELERLTQQVRDLQCSSVGSNSSDIETAKQLRSRYSSVHFKEDGVVFAGSKYITGEPHQPVPEREITRKKREVAFALKRDNPDLTIADIAKSIGCSATTVRDWFAGCEEFKTPKKPSLKSRIFQLADIHPDWSPTQIAKHLGAAPSTVSRYLSFRREKIMSP